MTSLSQKILNWARELQALSQTGLAFSRTPFETARYRRIARIAAEMVAACSHASADTIEKIFLSQKGYATVKVDVRAAAVRDEAVLLVQEKSDGKWCLPGGWADVGESPAQACVREAQEESGFRLLAKKLIGVFDANRGAGPLELFHAYKLIFLCEIEGGEAAPSVETAEVAFFSFQRLPPLSEHRTAARHLAEVKAHLEDPSRPAAFQ